MRGAVTRFEESEATSQAHQQKHEVQAEAMAEYERLKTEVRRKTASHAQKLATAER